MTRDKRPSVVGVQRWLPGLSSFIGKTLFRVTSFSPPPLPRSRLSRSKSTSGLFAAHSGGNLSSPVPSKDEAFICLCQSFEYFHVLVCKRMTTVLVVAVHDCFLLDDGCGCSQYTIPTDDKLGLLQSPRYNTGASAVFLQKIRRCELPFPQGAPKRCLNIGCGMPCGILAAVVAVPQGRATCICVFLPAPARLPFR